MGYQVYMQLEIFHDLDSVKPTKSTVQQQSVLRRKWYGLKMGMFWLSPSSHLWPDKGVGVPYDQWIEEEIGHPCLGDGLTPRWQTQNGSLLH